MNGKKSVVELQDRNKLLIHAGKTFRLSPSKVKLPNKKRVSAQDQSDEDRKDEREAWTNIKVAGVSPPH
jgi:hypothetical protein